MTDEENRENYNEIEQNEGSKWRNDEEVEHADLASEKYELTGYEERVNE